MQETFASKVREGLDTSGTELDRELKNVHKDSGKVWLSVCTYAFSVTTFGQRTTKSKGNLQA